VLDADDGDHERAAAVVHRIAAEARPRFVTNEIEAEAHALLLRKLGRAIAREWLLTGGLPVLRVLPQVEERLLGSSTQQRLLAVAFAERPPRTRLISARQATRQERRRYEAKG
jgi:hypothetical protein